MNNCISCGKLIMEPGVAYGYAGPVCQCIVYPKIQNDGSARYIPTPLEDELFGAKTPFSKACEQIETLESQLAILREALEQAIAELEKLKLNGYGIGARDSWKDALKKCFVEGE